MRCRPQMSHPVSAGAVGLDDGPAWEPSPAARRKERNNPQKAALPKSGQKPRGQPAASAGPVRAAPATNARPAATGSRAGPASLTSSQRLLPPGQQSQQVSPKPEVGASAASKVAAPARTHIGRAGKAPAWQKGELSGQAAPGSIRSKAGLPAQQAPVIAEATSVGGSEECSGRLSRQLSDEFPALGGASALPALPSSSGAATAQGPWTQNSGPTERGGQEAEADLDSEQVLRDLGLVSLGYAETRLEHPEYLPDKLHLHPPQQWSSTSRREDFEEVNHLLEPPQRPRPWTSHHLPPPYLRSACFHNPNSSVFSGG